MIRLLVLALAIGAVKLQLIPNTPVINDIQTTDGSEQVTPGTMLNLNVTAIRGQIVIKSISDIDQTVAAGRGLNLSVTFQIWPINYEKKWYKLIQSPLYGNFKKELKFDSRIRNSVQESGSSGSAMKTFTEQVQISDALIEDSGTYILNLVAGNDLMKSIELDVLVDSSNISSKIFVTQPTNTSAIVDARFLQLGSTYKFVCLARGLPLPSITVQRKACISRECTSGHEWEDVFDGDSTVFSGTYEVAKVTTFVAQQSFTYQCLTEGNNRTISSSPKTALIVTDVSKSEENQGMDVQIWVHSPDPNVDDGIPNATYENDRLILACRVQKYDYSMISWYQVSDTNQERVIANQHESVPPYVRMFNDSGAFSNRLELHFDRLRVNDSGTYRCKANYLDSGSKQTDKKIKVQRVEKPSFKTENDHSPSHLEVNYEEMVVLYCAAVGIPKPIIDWYKDGKPMEPNTSIHYSIDKQNVTIMRAVESDQGSYTCKAHNRAGFIWNNVSLAVIGAPTPTLTPTSTPTSTPTQMSPGAIIAIVCGSLVALSVILCLGILLIRQAKLRRHRQLVRQLDARNRLLRSSMAQSKTKNGFQTVPTNDPDSDIMAVQNDSYIVPTMRSGEQSHPRQTTTGISHSIVI